MMGARPSELELMAYADGELDAAAAERVRAHVEADAAAARQVRAYRKLNEAGARAMGTPAIPDGLRRRVERAAAEADGRGGRWRVGMFSGVAALLLVGLATAVIWSRATGGVPVVRDAGAVPVAYVSSAAAV